MYYVIIGGEGDCLQNDYVIASNTTTVKLITEGAGGVF